MRGALWPDASVVAKQCLLDCLGVTLAARGEPLVEILVAELASTSAGGDARSSAAWPADMPSQDGEARCNWS